MNTAPTTDTVAISQTLPPTANEETTSTSLLSSTAQSADQLPQPPTQERWNSVQD